MFKSVRFQDTKQRTRALSPGLFWQLRAACCYKKLTAMALSSKVKTYITPVAKPMLRWFAWICLCIQTHWIHAAHVMLRRCSPEFYMMSLHGTGHMPTLYPSEAACCKNKNTSNPRSCPDNGSLCRGSAEAFGSGALMPKTPSSPRKCPTFAQGFAVPKGPLGLLVPNPLSSPPKMVPFH